MGKVDGQVVVTLDAYAGLVGVKPADGGDALGRCVEGALALVESDADY